MKKYLKEYIYENLKSIIIILSLIIIGLVVGIISFNISNQEIKTEIILTVKNTLDISKDENFEGINILFNSIGINIFVISIIYFSAVTLIPKLFINLVSFFKGISLGLYIPILFNIFSIGNGILSLILLIILPNIIYISAYIYMCNNSILFHNKVIEQGIKLSIICVEIFKIVITLALFIGSVILEQIGIYIVINNYITL